MMLLIAFTFRCLTLASVPAACAHAGTVMRTVASLAQKANGIDGTNILFDITATITSPVKTSTQAFVAEDSSGSMLFKRNHHLHFPQIRQGDLIRAKGRTQRQLQTNFTYAEIGQIEIISHKTPSPPIDIDWNDIRKGAYDNRLVKIKGTVRDAFRDEIDRAWDYIQLQHGQESIFVCLLDNKDEQDLRKLIGAEVSAVGIYTPHRGMRRMLGNTIYATGWSDFIVTKPAPANPFDVPELDETTRSALPDLDTAGRRRTAGKVVAVWHGDRILLRSAGNSIVRVDLMDSNPPKYGDFVEVTGRPETDLYRLNLSRAIWRRSSDPENSRNEPSPVDATVRMLTTNPSGERAFQTNYHGMPIRISGSVISLPAPDGDCRLGLECESQIIPVDASSCPDAFKDLEIGCTIQASGTCLMESANWHPNAPFPHIEGFSVIVRTPDDIKILSYPPWWTVGRLFAVIGALLGLLSGIFAWNRMLNRLAERRGRELADEKVAHVSSDLKVYERTRLAVELHDSLSQNLTGVSLAIRAANRLARSDPDGMRQSLNVAAKALDSCRDELRNCLWDLRNLTLEESDMNEAIRQTLAPHVGDTELHIRFNVSRERLSDNTAHSILRIIRELASNAVRHGGATTIKIAGSIENETLRFSVSDNGCGFNPANHPGVADGHFGLQGIQDRVDAFEGEMSVRSIPGKGTKATISIKANNA